VLSLLQICFPSVFFSAARDVHPIIEYAMASGTVIAAEI
jgi:hypothetical protein